MLTTSNRSVQALLFPVPYLVLCWAMLTGLTHAATPTPAAAMRLFGWSITYITVLFGAMAVDQLAGLGWPW